MSQTQQARESVVSTRERYDHEPREVFREEIERDHTICNRCFRAQYRLETVAIPVRYADEEYGYEPVEEADVAEETVLCQTQEQTANVDTCHPPRVSGPVYDPDGDDPTAKLEIPLEHKRANPPEKIVCRCGAIDRDGTRPPLATQEAVEHGIRISNRLREAGVAHDRELLKRKLCEWKREPTLASKDDDLFQHAVRMAVARARGRTPPGIVAVDGEIEPEA